MLIRAASKPPDIEGMPLLQPGATQCQYTIHNETDGMDAADVVALCRARTHSVPETSLHTFFRREP